MIIALIFDLDGVLIDLCEVHRKAFREALLRCAGIKIDEEFEKTLEAIPTRTKLERIGVIGRTAIDVANLKQELTLKELENIQEDKELREILLELAENYDLYCCSNSTRETVELVLSKLNIIDLFENYYGNNDVFMSKPSPEMYLKAIVQTPALVKEVLAIEDSLVGAETIKNVGCHGLMIKNRQKLTLEKIYNKIEEIENV